MTEQTKGYGLLTAEQMAHVLRLTSPHSFKFNIRRMNAMYKLPINTEPGLDKLHRPDGASEAASTRMAGFLNTLQDECEEGIEILYKLRLLEAEGGQQQFAVLERAKSELIPEGCSFIQSSIGGKVMDKLHKFRDLVILDPVEAEQDVLTDITDWLCDIQVYCRSEGMKYGLPIEEGLEAVMGSNFTKLPSDGIPIHDANGKFLKDMTNFVPPEPALKTILFGNASRPTSSEPNSISHLTSGQPESSNHPYSKIDQLEDTGPGTGAESDVL